MKRIFTILVAILFSLNIFAQAPEKMSYQSVVRNNSDQLVTNTLIGMQISVYKGSASGLLVYSETQTPTTNANGLLSLEIGTGNVVSGDFTTIDWSSDKFYIKTELDLDGGSNYTISATSQLLSVPYALHAKTAKSVTGTLSELDPVFDASIAKGISAVDTTKWNQKSDFSGDFNDLVNKPINNDNDATNELQDISINNDSLSITDGSTIALPIPKVTSSYVPTRVLASFSNTFQKIGDMVTLTKDNDNTIIEILFTGHISVDALLSNGAFFELRINDQSTTLGYSAIPLFNYQANKYTQVAISGLFPNIPAGSYTISMWVYSTDANGGSNAMINPGGYTMGNNILVKEYFAK